MFLLLVKECNFKVILVKVLVNILIVFYLVYVKYMGRVK